MRLRAAWEVRAGVIPMQAIPEHTKRFFYTSEDYEWDISEEGKQANPNKFTAKLDEATKWY